MSVSTSTNRRLAVALGSNTAASELVTILNTGVAGTDGSYTTITTTGDATIGGNLLLASGKVVKVNNVQVVGAQQANQVSVAVTYTSGSAPTITGNAITIADGTSGGANVTIPELLSFCTALKANVGSILTALKAHGLLASS